MIPEELDDPEVPEHIRQLCVACVQYVQRATGVVLDFTPDTLPVLDHYLTTVRDAKPELKDLVARAAGAYLGTVVRQEYPVRWHAPEDDPTAWRVEFERCFLHFDPVAFAREAIEGHDVVDGGAGFGVSADDLEVLRAALEVLGEMPADDYYRLSTRMEALGPIVDRLTAAALQRDEAALEFPHALYRDALGDDDGAPPS